jgi:RAD51-like protein 2
MGQLKVSDAERRSTAMLGACQREVADAWGSADSALELLTKAQTHRPIVFPSEGFRSLLGNSLRPGGCILEICGLPGTGKTQFCMQLCAAAQAAVYAGSSDAGSLQDSLQEAIYIDAEGSFTAGRYSQMCRAVLEEHTAAADTGAINTMLRRMHICRTYDAAEMYATIKQMEVFLQAHPRVRVLVVDSIAFCFRHEFADDAVQRARVLTDIAATLRRYGTNHNLVVVVTNHMTTRFDRNKENGAGWLAPALGETWAHQPSTQLRLERLASSAGSLPVGRATLTKSMEQAVGRSCLFNITEVGIRDISMRDV